MAITRIGTVLNHYCPPPDNEMKNFDNEWLLMVKNIEFKNVKNEFQQRLKEDINEIETRDKTFVAEDKSRHTYKMEK